MFFQSYITFCFWQTLEVAVWSEELFISRTHDHGRGYEKDAVKGMKEFRLHIWKDKSSLSGTHFRLLGSGGMMDAWCFSPEIVLSRSPKPPLNFDIMSPRSTFNHGKNTNTCPLEWARTQCFPQIEGATLKKKIKKQLKTVEVHLPRTS